MSAHVESELDELGRLPLYLPVQEVAALLGVHRSTVWRMIDRGELEARHVGGATRVTRTSLVEWARRQADAATATVRCSERNPDDERTTT